MDDFEWRVSLADVAADGPFSVFPGVDRVLTVIAGDGLVLEVEGKTERLQPGVPFAFPGDADVVARLTSGPIRDLNVMVRRGAWTARVTPWRGEVEASTDRPTLVVLLESTQDFAALDMVLFDPGETVTLDLPSSIKALVVVFSAPSPTIG
jgi:environmental stress-induced protein Ves